LSSAVCLPFSGSVRLLFIDSNLACAVDPACLVPSLQFPCHGGDGVAMGWCGATCEGINQR
jgi:hypothetical protein